MGRARFCTGRKEMDSGSGTPNRQSPDRPRPGFGLCLMFIAMK